MKSVQEAPLAHYVREYSALPGLQQAHRVEYTLRSSEAAPVSYYTAALEEVPACRLLCYLYENSIGPEQLRDVLSDFCGRTL